MQQNRQQTKLVRILKMIDCLAPLRRPMTVSEITVLVNDYTGVPVSERTISRDIDLLAAIGLVEIIRRPSHTYRGSTAGLYRLSLRRSESVQQAAIAIGAQHG